MGNSESSVPSGRKHVESQRISLTDVPNTLDSGAVNYVDINQVISVKELESVLTNRAATTKYNKSTLPVNLGDMQRHECLVMPQWVVDSPPWKHLWKNTYWLPNLNRIPRDGMIVIQGGISTFGSRYPTITITSVDIEILRNALVDMNILTKVDQQQKDSVDITFLLDKIELCTSLVQYWLMTNTFNNRCTESRWGTFDSFSDVFRNQCMQELSYVSLKNKVNGAILTSLSMLPFLFGDCREHSILLHVLARIVIDYYGVSNHYYVSGLYSTGGEEKNHTNGHQHNGYRSVDVQGAYEHTFPVLWDMKQQRVYFLDALHHRSPITPFPGRENQSGVPVEVVMPTVNEQARQSRLPKHLFLDNPFAYKGGYFYTDSCRSMPGPAYIVVPVLFSKSMCKYNQVTDTELTSHMFVYGMRVQQDTEGLKSLLISKQFQEQRQTVLKNAQLCRRPGT